MSKFLNDIIGMYMIMEIKIFTNYLLIKFKFSNNRQRKRCFAKTLNKNYRQNCQMNEFFTDKLSVCLGWLSEKQKKKKKKKTTKQNLLLNF